MGAFVTFWDNDAGSKIQWLANPGQDVAPIGAARQEDSLLDSQMQLGSLQYPRNPMKGASEHFLRPRGYLRRHSAQHRHRPRRLPAPQLHCRLSHRARAQDAAEWCSGDFARFTFKGLDGTMTKREKRPGVPLLHF